MKCSDLIKYFEVTGMQYFKHSISMKSFLAFLSLILFWCEINFWHFILILQWKFWIGTSCKKMQEIMSKTKRVSFFKKSRGSHYATANLKIPYSRFCKAKLVALPWIIRPAIFNFGKRKKRSLFWIYFFHKAEICLVLPYNGGLFYCWH